MEWTSPRRCSSIWADEPKFVTIKESSENIRRVIDLKNLCGDRYLLFCGVDDLVLVIAPDHEPATSGSCYFDVSDVEALRREFLDAGAEPSAIEVQEYGGKRFRLFFLKEDYDDYCFCFGEPA